ncbi:hypothetical protein Mal15_68730 [Stieleria maiorica]|uniref:Uncharacterized protein n=1 Tax=Stieleria maiorica TaxID=2795974 RepID=A0A5B9MMX7_9BACT|nr:hypothetical protein Mal15_68730 [Stieleria maiorica]
MKQGNPDRPDLKRTPTVLPRICRLNALRLNALGTTPSIRCRQSGTWGIAIKNSQWSGWVIETRYTESAFRHSYGLGLRFDSVIIVSLRRQLLGIDRF